MKSDYAFYMTRISTQLIIDTLSRLLIHTPSFALGVRLCWAALQRKRERDGGGDLGFVSDVRNCINFAQNFHVIFSIFNLAHSIFFLYFSVYI